MVLMLRCLEKIHQITIHTIFYRLDQEWIFKILKRHKLNLKYDYSSGDMDSDIFYGAKI